MSRNVKLDAVGESEIRSPGGRRASPAPTWPTSSTRRRFSPSAPAATGFCPGISTTPSSGSSPDSRRRTGCSTRRSGRIVAYHETGHALVAAFTKGADPVHKISIIPRGIGSLGYTIQLPTEDRFLLTEEELLGKIDVLLGGRASEQVFFGEISTGASNDITRATDIARKMISEYGMSEKFKNVVLPFGRGPRCSCPGESIPGRAGILRVHPAVHRRGDHPDHQGALRKSGRLHRDKESDGR